MDTSLIANIANMDVTLFRESVYQIPVCSITQQSRLLYDNECSL